MSKLLTGKIAIITGASRGLGFEIAKKYASAGANLMLCARDNNALVEAIHELKKYKNNSQEIYGASADISVEKNANYIVNLTLDQLGGCHILVNNAGIYGPKGKIEDVIWDDWVTTFSINVFGSVLMCRALLPHFKQQRYGKIIQLSGGGATNPLPKISAYAATKAAIVRFSETLAEEVREHKIDVNAMAPGALNTQMLDEVIAAGSEVVGFEFYQKALRQKENGGASIELAADLALFLASSTSDGITGKLISAAWDNWIRWPEHLNELNETDAYTLRRIVGRDRNIAAWGDR